MQNYTFIFLATFLFSFSLNSQTHHEFSASGGDASNTSGSIAYSMGQIVYTTTNNSTGKIAQGIQQAKRPNTVTALFLNLKVLIDGYYINNSNPPLMVPARYTNLLESGSLNPGLATDADMIQVELRRPSSLEVASYTVNGMLKTNGVLQCSFPTSALVGTYYIVVKHRSCLPLWSSTPISITATTMYNFTDAATKAYSDGDIPAMKEIALGVYAIYMGEMNEDDYLDASDFPIWWSDITLSNDGEYLLDSDFNGDTFVDNNDFPIFEFNSAVGLNTQRPY